MLRLRRRHQLPAPDADPLDLWPTHHHLPRVMVVAIGVYLKKYNPHRRRLLHGGTEDDRVESRPLVHLGQPQLASRRWAGSRWAYQYGMLGRARVPHRAIPAILFLAIRDDALLLTSATHSVPGLSAAALRRGARSLAGISFSVLTVMVRGASMFAMAKILNLLLGGTSTSASGCRPSPSHVYVTLGGLLSRSSTRSAVLPEFLCWSRCSSRSLGLIPRRRLERPD